MYNTGSTSRGFRNGYVAKVVGNAGLVDAPLPDPVMSVSGSLPEPTPPVQSQIDGQRLFQLQQAEARQADPSSRPSPPRWNVFERATFERDATMINYKERVRL